MLYNIAYCIVRAFCFFIFRIKIEGKENIPDASALVCANHTSNFDPVFLAFALGLRIKPAFLAKAELFKNPVFGWLLKSFGAIPIERGKADVKAIKSGFRALKNGKKLIMFPEGTRNKNGEDLEAKLGAGMFAAKTGAYVLPVYISPEKRLFHSVRVIIGNPYKPQIDADVKVGHDQFKCISDEILKKINMLGGV